jgi:hypothetical protein
MRGRGQRRSGLKLAVVSGAFVPFLCAGIILAASLRRIPILSRLYSRPSGRQHRLRACVP